MRQQKDIKNEEAEGQLHSPWGLGAGGEEIEARMSFLLMEDAATTHDDSPERLVPS